MEMSRINFYIILDDVIYSECEIWNFYFTILSSLKFELEIKSFMLVLMPSSSRLRAPSFPNHGVAYNDIGA